MDSNIRKLRKKLRQIEHLEEIERDLTDEEVSKCMKKELIRQELLELLTTHNSPKSETEPDNDSSIATSVSTPVSEIGVEGSCIIENQATDFSTKLLTENINNSSESQTKEEQLDTLPGTRSVSKSGQNAANEMQKSEYSISRDKSSTPSNRPSSTKKGSDLTKSENVKSSWNPLHLFSSPEPKVQGDRDSSIRVEWSHKKFQVSVLESHNDLITAVDCCDGLLVSASRDTTVKVWDMETLSELRSLGSHTGCVTDVVVLPGNVAAKLGASITVCEDDHIILSGSSDCSLNIWLAKTGELLKSVYTYNPITKVAFYPDLSLVATASDGGKLELWNINTKVNVCSKTAHSDSITGLCVSDGKIYTSCAAEGEIKVFEVRGNELHCIFASERLHNVTGDRVTMRHVRSLGVKGDNIYYGDDGVNLKLLTWKKGRIKKIANHKEEFGMTDAIHCHGDLMMTSAYDLDNGHGYINVFDLSAEPNYVTTIDCEDTRRILDIGCDKNRNGNISIVTAGLDLQVWKQISTCRNDDNNIETKFIQSLSQPGQDSDIESDVDFTESESEGGSRRGSRRGSNQSQTTSWMSWCTLT